MKITPIKNPIVFKSGYPTFGTGHCSAKDTDFVYIGYPGMIPTDIKEPTFTGRPYPKRPEDGILDILV